MVLAPVFEPELLLSALLILLRYRPSFHLLSRLQCLSFHMLLSHDLILG